MKVIQLPSREDSLRMSLFTEMEVFVHEHFNRKISIKDNFILPKRPFRINYMPILDPGRISTDKMIQLLSANLGFRCQKHFMFRDFWDLKIPARSRLVLSEYSLRPNGINTGNRIRDMSTWRVPLLNIREYMIMFGFLYSKGQLLDKESTTVFPKHTQWSSGIWAATASWDHKESLLEFDIRDSCKINTDNTLGPRIIQEVRRR